MKLDEKDFAILDILKANSKLSTQKIAKTVKIPITTVHNRIKKLEKEGIIRNYTVNVDNKKLGKGLSAYVLITVDYKLLKELKTQQYDLAKKIKSHPSVEEASLVTGASDIIIKVRVSDIDELSEFVTKYLRNVNGVEKTQTAVILAEVIEKWLSESKAPTLPFLQWRTVKGGPKTTRVSENIDSILYG